MNVLKATKKDFKKVKRIKVAKRIHFDSFVVLPNKKIHDSGFRCMDFILLDSDSNPIGKVGGASDAIYIEKHYQSSGLSKTVHADLLPCGLIRIWVRKGMFIEHNPISDMDVYYEGR